MNNLSPNTPVLILGESPLALSTCMCLLIAGHKVTLYSKNSDDTLSRIENLYTEPSQYNLPFVLMYLNFINKLSPQEKDILVIAITDEDLTIKQKLINSLEDILDSNTPIAINTQSILLDDIQQGAKNPSRIVGLNWVLPAHTTFFLEIISNSLTNSQLVQNLTHTAKHYWQKDPYVVKTGFSVNTRLMCAMIREAFFLVESGYVSFEDIDRACRNDAGYYLPFTGNFRYMDLMGTYIYGLVMKDLNPELSTDNHIPDFFTVMIENADLGMESGQGFYHYTDKDAENRTDLFKNFSYQIRDIIAKYPFNYLQNNTIENHKLSIHEQ
jgi:3-hydroxybutyryl-CoA dehydrogenase